MRQIIIETAHNGYTLTDHWTDINGEHSHELAVFEVKDLNDKPDVHKKLLMAVAGLLEIVE